MTHGLWIFVALVGIARVSATFAADARPIQLTPRGAATRPVAYQVMEWAIDLGRAYDNPFDPDQIAIDGTFTGPHGKTVAIPGFWFAECAPEIHPDGSEHWIEKGPGHFLIRAAFPEPGDWQLVVASRDKEGSRSSPPLTFHVAPSVDPGFIRRCPDNTRYLQFDSGKPYFAVGLNLGWPGPRGSLEYEEWFAHLAGAGGNFARIWMCAPNRRMETLKLGLGRYDQGACAYYDQLLELAAAHHVACMLTFNNHIQLLTSSPWGAGGWPDDLYNSAKGGPATQPVNFFDAGRARQLYKQRLRYIVGRYSAFTSVMAWELWNEQELTKVKIPIDWTREMAAYLHAIDPYRHLVTTSYAETGEAETWSLPEIDLVQRHLYGDEGSLRDTAGAYIDVARHLDAFAKPGLLAELGISWRNPDTKFDAAGIGTNLHNGLWAGALSGGFGGGCSWWWDNYVTPKNLWRVYTGLARFAAEVDWPRRKFEPIEVRWPRLPATQPAGYSDVELSATGTWGRAIEKPLTLNIEGSLSGPLPGFLYGPSKPKMRLPTVLHVDLPNPSRMTVLVAEVSELSILRVTVDGTLTRDLRFEAKPGSARLVSTTQRADTHNWVGTFNDPCPVELSPGHHTITLDNIEGDWLLIASVTFTQCKSLLISDVRPVVLQDSASGETLAWLQDVKSNWYSDSKGVVPRRYDGLTLFVPVPRAGKYQVDWWDTRSGQIVRTDSVAATDLQLQLRIPDFERDIALRATPIVDHVSHAEVEKALRENLLEVWFPRALDREQGGFLCDFDYAWQPAGPQPKTIVFQARSTWLASVASERYPNDPRYREAADHGFRFLRDVMWDKQHDGWYWHLDRGGRQTPEWLGVKHAYGVSFGIYACAAHYHATHDPQSLALAQVAFGWLEEHGHDARHGGYYEYFAVDGSPILDDASDPRHSPTGRDAIGTQIGYKSMNTHIHLLESITALYGVWPDPTVKARLAELLGIVRDKIVAPPGAMHQFFNADWTPVPDVDSFGHDLETAYLLVEASDALGQPQDARTTAVAKSLADHALDYGWDKTLGGFYENGGVFGPVHERHKGWWTQAEALNTLQLMSRLFPHDPRDYDTLFARQWHYMQANVFDTTHGEWYVTGLDTGGDPKAPKATEWKAGYHGGWALMNVVDRLGSKP